MSVSSLRYQEDVKINIYELQAELLIILILSFVCIQRS